MMPWRTHPRCADNSSRGLHGCVLVRVQLGFFHILIDSIVGNTRDWDQWRRENREQLYLQLLEHRGLPTEPTELLAYLREWVKDPRPLGRPQSKITGA